MRRRVDVEAEYNVTCEAYRHSLTNNIMMTVAEQRYSVIEHLCGGRKYLTTDVPLNRDVGRYIPPSMH